MILVHVVFLIAAVVIGLALSEECTGAWILYGEKCYFFSSETQSGINALTACANVDSESKLAAITNQNINDRLWNISRINSLSYWIGLTGYTKGWPSTWYWNDGTLFLNEFNWADREPTGDSTCSRLMANRELADKKCTASHNFICQTTERAPNNDQESWHSHNDYWFFFSNFNTNEYEASRYCFGKGGYLAGKEVTSISNLEEKLDGKEYWIGLTLKHWTDRSHYKWHNFHNNPSDNDENCYMLHGSENKWEPAACSQSKHYICSKDKENSLPETTTLTTKLTTKTTVTSRPPSTTTTSTTTTTTTLSSTSTTTTLVPVTPPPSTSTTSTFKSTSTISAPMTFVTGDDTDSEVVVNTTSSDQITLAVSNGETKGFSDGNSALMYTLIVICALIVVLVVIIIVLVVLSRRRVAKQSDKERLHTDTGDGENQQMAQLPGPSSQSRSQMKTNTAHRGTSTAQEQPTATATASDGVPIYAVPNKKKAVTEKL